MNHTSCMNNRMPYTRPSEKQKAVWQIEREIECIEYLLNATKERLEKAKLELDMEKLKNN